MWGFKAFGVLGLRDFTAKGGLVWGWGEGGGLGGSGVWYLGVMLGCIDSIGLGFRVLGFRV